MGFLDYLVIIIGFASLVLGYFILARGPKNNVAFSLASVAIITGIWAVALLLYHLEIFFSSFTWIKVVYIIVFFLVINVFHFSSVFPYKTKRSASLPILIYTIVSLPLLYILLFTDLWVKDVIFKSWGPETILGPAYGFVVFFWGCFGTWTIYNLLRKYLISFGINRARIKYVLVGITLFIIVIATIPGIIPLVTGSTRYFRIAPLSSLFFVGFTAYAIFRYRLMDIRIVLRAGIVYFLSILILISAVLGAIYLFSSLVGYTPNVKLTIIGGAAMATLLLIFIPLKDFLLKLTNRYFFKAVYTTQEALKNLREKITTIIELDELIAEIVDTIKKALGLSSISLLLKEEGVFMVKENIGLNKGNVLAITEEESFSSFFENKKEVLVAEEIEREEKLGGLRERMEKINICLVFPLFAKRELIGLVVLGPKLGNEAYTKEDLELLEILCSQAAVAIENAKLYEEIQSFNKTLQQKVDEQTKELRTTYEELKKLDQAKTEFVSMASHQLRTPLSAIKGYASMLFEGSYGKLEPKQEEKLKNILTSNERLIGLVNDLLDISKMDLGKMELNASVFQLEELVNDCCQEIMPLAKEKGLKFVWEKPMYSLPEIEADELKIKEVVSNLLDNSVKYTKIGEIIVKLEKINSSLRLSIRDTGEGITKEDAEKLFQTFGRGSAGINTFIEGTGLGLMVAKRFVDLHKGKLWVESAGAGKGSTFYLELPIRA